MNAGILGLAVGSTRYYLSRAQRFRAVRICVLLVATSCLDVVGLATLVPVMLVAAEPGGVAKSRLFAPVYHALHFQSERQFLLTLIAGIFLFFLLKNLFTTWVNHVLTAFTVDLGTSVARTQVDKYLHFPFWHFNQLGSSNLTLNAMELPLQYVGMVVRPLFVLFSEMAVVLAIVVTILLFKPLLLGLLAVVLVPATLLTYRALRQRTQAIGNEFNALRLVLYGTIGDLFTGVVELKLAGKQYQFRDRFLANQRGLQELDAESYRYSLLPLRVIEMVAIAGVLTIFLYAILAPSPSADLVALVGLFAAAAYRVMPSVNRMLTALMQIKQATSTITKLEAYRELAYNEMPHPAPLPLPFRHSIVFEQVGFRFPGAPAPTLHGISLRIRKGEKIGFIGSSGSGKTTLMNVLLRFYTEQEGRILVDGEPLTPRHLAAWHHLVGYVKQDAFLMEASIRDNVTLADAPVDETRLAYAI